MRVMQTFEVANEAQIEEVVTALLKEAEMRRAHTKSATTIALHGDLGAGKTTTVQHLARSLNIEEQLVSPTFVVMKSYQVASGPWQRLTHVDAYRIESIEEMHVLHFADILAEQDTIVCIEWAERIEELLPEDTIHVRFTLKGEDRLITIE